MRKNKIGISLITFISSILIIILLIVLIVLIINNNKHFTQNTKGESVSNVENSNSVYTDENSNNSDPGLNSWNGIYESNNSYIEMYRTSKDELLVNIICTGENFMGDFFKIKLDSATELSYNKNNNNLIIKKTTDGITVQASSNDKNSILKQLDSQYTKKDFNSMNWDNLYTNGNMSITLAQIDNEHLVITIFKNQFSISSIGVTEFSDTTIDHESTMFDNIAKLHIEKIENGIVVKSSSTIKDDILNEANGTYYIQ